MQGPAYGNYVVDNIPNQYAHDPWLTNSAFPVSRDPAPYHPHPGLDGMGHHAQLYASPSAGNQQMAGLFQAGYSYDAHGNSYINQNVGVDGFDTFGGVHGGRGYVPAPDHGQQAYFAYRGLQQNEALTSHGSAHLSGPGHVPTQSPWSGISEAQQQHHPVPLDAAHTVEHPPTVGHTLPQSPWGAVEDSAVKPSGTETSPTDPTIHAAKAKEEVAAPVENAPEVPSPAPVEAVAETLSELSIAPADDPSPVTIPRRPSPVQSTPEPVVQPTAAPKAAKAVAKNVEQSSPAPSRPVEPAAPSPAPKSAWAVEDESNKAAAISLREIQEAEAKKAEAKKLLERERERLNRAPSGSETKEDVQPFTASWGLPTSQAGRNVHSSAKDTSPASSSPTSTTPVWSAPAKQAVAKKSMKEILEEEEKRKKQAVAKEQAAAAPVKRAYAETTTKVCGSTPTFPFIFLILASSPSLPASLAARGQRSARVAKARVLPLLQHPLLGLQLRFLRFPPPPPHRALGLLLLLVRE